MLANQMLMLTAVFGGVVLIAWAIYWDFRKKRLEFDERRLMIEKGLAPPSPRSHALAGWPGVKQHEQQLRYEERRLRIEKGLEVPPDAPVPLKPEDYLRRGLIGVALGLGCAIGYGVLRFSGLAVPDAASFQAGLGVLSPVVTLFGLANLVHFQLTRNTRTSADPRQTDRAT